MQIIKILLRFNNQHLYKINLNLMLPDDKNSSL
jgi:hypothetical protein